LFNYFARHYHCPALPGRQMDIKGGKQMKAKQQLKLISKYLHGEQKQDITEKVLTIVFLIACAASIVIAWLL